MESWCLNSGLPFEILQFPLDSGNLTVRDVP
jgi:hypothetical protein